jgi:diphosphomevalonate decarboxylase
VQVAEESLNPIKSTILNKNFDELAALAESNCVRFHCSAMAAYPPITYWQGQTVDLMHHIGDMRRRGLKVFFTIDAGPNVVAFCEPSHTEQVRTELARHPGLTILRTKVGRGARTI